MWWFDRLIEEKIKQGKREGHFSRLSGEGKPLRQDNSELAGENWLAHHIMEEAGVLPEWLSLRKDIAEERPLALRYRNEAEERLRLLPLREWDTDARLKRLVQLYLKQVEKVNLMVEQHNHRCPSIQHELVKLRDDAIDRARQRIKRERISGLLQRSTDGSVQ